MSPYLVPGIIYLYDVLVVRINIVIMSRVARTINVPHCVTILQVKKTRISRIRYVLLLVTTDYIHYYSRETIENCEGIIY